jgi:hypothetical protein
LIQKNVRKKNLQNEEENSKMVGSEDGKEIVADSDDEALQNRRNVLPVDMIVLESGLSKTPM